MWVHILYAVSAMRVSLTVKKWMILAQETRFDHKEIKL